MSEEYYRIVFMENLNFYLSLRQKKQSDLCKDLALSKSTVSSWCTGKKIPRMDKIELLANYLNIDKSDLIEKRKTSKISVPNVSEIGQYVYGQQNKLPEGAIPVDISTFIKIPVYGEVSAGAGCLADNYIIGYEYVTPDSINKYDDYFFLKVKGDSMEPQICNGDYALIQKQSSIDSGSLAVVIIDNENGVIKKVNYGSDWIELVSFNPYYPPRRFEGSDVQRISVVGLVKEIKRKF